MSQPLKTFIIYAREDAVFKNELLRHLTPFAQHGLLEKWDDSHILPGEDWAKSIKQALEASQIVLMLVSANSLFSDFIQREELRTALEQKRAGTTRVIPILVQDCMHEMAPGISDLQMLPLHPVSRSLVPVDDLVTWGSRASAWAAALRQLREVIADVHTRVAAQEAAAADTAAWEKAARAADRAAYEAYLHNPDHLLHRKEAEQALADLAQQEKAQRDQEERLAANLAADLAAEAQRAKEADQRAKEADQQVKEALRQTAAAERQRLKDEAAWKGTLKVGTLEAYEAYLDDDYTLHQAEAHQRIQELTEADAERKAAQKAEEKRRREAAETAARKKAEEEKADRLAADLAAEARRAKEAAAQQEAQRAKEAAAQQEARRAKEAAQRAKEAEAEAARRADPFHDSMLLIKGGSFDMGDTFGDGGDTEKPVHRVTLSDFAIGKYPVTVEQYLAFANETKSHYPEWLEKGSNYNIQTGKDDHYKKLGAALQAPNHPIVGISWDDAIAYCQWLSTRTGRPYRLPTEAEWEYAARGGQQSKGYKYAGSNNLDEVGWFWENSGDKRLSGDWSEDKITKNNCRTHPVGQKKANELGLCDMSGNVWEWCQDTWHDTYAGAPDDGSTWEQGGNEAIRVVRGGSWDNNPDGCRAARRYGLNTGLRNLDCGLRLAR